MKKVNRSEVPVEYRRNHKKEFIEFCKIAAGSFIIVAAIAAIILIGL